MKAETEDAAPPREWLVARVEYLDRLANESRDEMGLVVGMLAEITKAPGYMAPGLQWEPTSPYFVGARINSCVEGLFKIMDKLKGGP